MLYVTTSLLCFMFHVSGVSLLLFSVLLFANLFVFLDKEYVNHKACSTHKDIKSPTANRFSYLFFVSLLLFCFHLPAACTSVLYFCRSLHYVNTVLINNKNKKTNYGLLIYSCLVKCNTKCWNVYGMLIFCIFMLGSIYCAASRIYLDNIFFLQFDSQCKLKVI